MTSEFQSRLLYSQKSSAVINEQEPVSVSSTIYALRFLYPGASQHTTGRVRITCTYRDTDQFESHSGVIERWTDKGWILLDDYTDDVLAFHSEEEFRSRMLNYTQSFIMGIPLSSLDVGYVSKDTSISNHIKSKPKRLFNFDSKEMQKPENEKKPTPDNKYKGIKIKDTDSSNDDDDDLDWL